MKYPKNTAIGDAGEFYFAYNIAKMFGWPCRLFDIDIGIDAQVEILDEYRNSTGKFVAFQIKTTSDEEDISCRYVYKKQILYWLDLDFPVFVVLVKLSDGAMYLHKINKLHKYHETESGQVRIDFHMTRDQFNEKTGERIKAAAEETALASIREYLKPVQDGTKEINDELLRSENSPEPEELINVMLKRTSLRKNLAQAETLVINTRVGDTEYLETERRLESALSELRTYMKSKNMQYDWDDSRYGDGEIRKFLDENR